MERLTDKAADYTSALFQESESRQSFWLAQEGRPPAQGFAARQIPDARRLPITNLLLPNVLSLLKVSRQNTRGWQGYR
ncbi:hypothetical protein FHS18_004086 [Paenibacillus phyllosphaerae]|uniref:Uncharacterized protein n=1 Tax=Paenibacillus phyllosphaerae TaxID=274593 RepID=A0A7W5B067_9BACL|nr:hypothetical protein [Paenibacillus phyllosphaerae]MBB3112008.1 hypothetical protein [Paenibacillus phyllosphaerae]